MDHVEFINLMLSDGNFGFGVVIGSIIGAFLMGRHKDKELQSKLREIKQKDDALDKAERRRVEESKANREEIEKLKEELVNLEARKNKEIASLKISASAKEFKL